MYEVFYGLTERPFNLTPDPRFLFKSEKHKEAFAHLLFGIKNRAGFVMVTGEIGTGKTTICRSIMGQLDPDTEVSFIFNPCLSPEELLRKINEDFGIDSQASTIKDLIDELNSYLLERAAKGKNCVLVIDEAQNLTPRVLEQIRLLSNLETESAKLLQIVLIGQPELGQNLELPELRQLNQRITARYHLKELSREETMQYIAYRLRVAGGRKKVRFTRKAVNRIYAFSGGTPRVINTVCDRALLIGYTEETKDITPRIIKRACRELKGERMKRSSAWQSFKSLIPGRLTISMALIIVLVGQFIVRPLLEEQRIRSNRPIVKVVSAPEPAPQPQEPVPAPVVPASPVPVVAPEPTEPPEPAAPSFGEQLDTVQPAVSLNAGCVALLRAWGQSVNSAFPANEQPETIAAFAERNGLNAVVLNAGLAQLRQLNMPALVRVAGDHHSAYVALLSMSDDEVVVSLGMGHTASLSVPEFEGRYLLSAIVFWKDPRPAMPVLMEGMTGPTIADMRARLARHTEIASDALSVYDTAMETAVRDLQKEMGITVDGKVGPQTRMVLAGLLGDYGGPTLTGTDEPQVAQVTPVTNDQDTAPPVSEPSEPKPEPQPAIEPTPTPEPVRAEESASSAQMATAPPSDENTAGPEPATVLKDEGQAQPALEEPDNTPDAQGDSPSVEDTSTVVVEELEPPEGLEKAEPTNVNTPTVEAAPSEAAGDGAEPAADEEMADQEEQNE